MSYIYVASPFSDNDPLVEQQRYEAVLRYCLEKLRTYEPPRLSPIIYGYQFYRSGRIQGSYRQWRTLNRKLLREADSMEVLMLPGWNRSLGLAYELGVAELQCKPILYIDPATFASTSRPD